MSSPGGGSSARAGAPIFFSIITLALFGFYAQAAGEMPPLAVVAAVVAIFVYILTLADIRIGIAVMIVSIGFSPEFSIGGTNNLRLEDLIVPILLISWITRAVEKRENFLPSPLKTPIYGYLFVATVSSLKGIALGDVELRTCLLYFGKTVEYFLMMVIVANNVRSLREARGFIYVTILVATATGLLGFNQFLGGGDAFSNTRVSGPYGESSNILGGYFIFHLSLAVGLLLFAEGLRSRVLYFACVCALFFPFLYTFSRTSYAALLGGLVLIGVLKSRRLLVALAILLFVLPFLLSAPVIDRAATILDVLGPKPPSSWNARVSGWRNFGNSVFSNPLFGRGISATPLLIDNEYVKQVVDTGLVGLGLFVIMLGIMAHMAFTVANKAQKEPVIIGFAVGYLAGLTCLAIHALGATSFTTIRTMEPLMVATGILAAIYHNYDTWTQTQKVSEELHYVPARHRRRMRPLPTG